MEGRAGVQVWVQQVRGRDRSRKRHKNRHSSQNKTRVTKISRPPAPTQSVDSTRSINRVEPFSVLPSTRTSHDNDVKNIDEETLDAPSIHRSSPPQAPFPFPTSQEGVGDESLVPRSLFSRELGDLPFNNSTHYSNANKNSRPHNQRDIPSLHFNSIARSTEPIEKPPKSQRSAVRAKEADQSNGRKDARQDRSTKNRKRQKRRKFFPCRCTPLCSILSVLGAILAAIALAAICIGILLPRTTTTKTTISTSSVSTTTSTTTTTVICTPPCLNGGTCVMPNNTCLCIADVWTGSQCQTPLRILWTFDNNLLDLYGNFPGTAINNPSYSSPGINGYGSCLYLNTSANQSVNVATPPFLNMALTSFSLSAWVRANSFRTGSAGCADNAIFGQFDQNILDHSLHIIVRNKRSYFGFFNDDSPGIQVLQPSVWYHLAYIYDYSIRTQFIYVNGVLDVANSTHGPYQGTSGSLSIGTNGVCTPNNTWDGCLDQISYFSRAKNASEVLRDATLTVSYSFNNVSLLDDGPLGINGTGTNVQYVTVGRVGPGLSLSSSPAFVQASGLVYLGTNSYPYSISIWIQPTSITSGTIIQVSSSSAPSTWSMPMLGFTSAGNIGVQACESTGAVVITGPVSTVGVWTHLAVTYSSSNGLRLWINGTQSGSASAAFASSTINAPVTMTLGASPSSAAGPCAVGVIVTGQYSGLMDEFALFSRELSSGDVLNLANP